MRNFTHTCLAAAVGLTLAGCNSNSLVSEALEDVVNSGGGTTGGGSAPSLANTKATTVVRKYAMDTQIDIKNPTAPPIIQYLVGDRNRSGGETADLTFTDDAITVKQASNDGKLETGDENKYVDSTFDKQSVQANGAKQYNYTKTSLTPAPRNDTAAIVDYDYARVGVSNLVHTQTGENYISLFYGKKDDTVGDTPAQSGTASYAGVAGAQIITREGVNGAIGDLALNANFDAAKIDGGITNIVITDQKGGEHQAEFDLQLNNAGIDGDRYAGSLEVVDNTGAGRTLIDTSNGANGRAEYHGQFFGNEAQETAGAIDITGTGADPVTGTQGRIDVVGTFIGQKK